MLSRIWSAAPSLSVLMVGCGGEATESVSTTRDPVSADCAAANTASGFVTRAFERQSGSFHVHFDATPAVAPTDALAGITFGSADGYGDLAAIVRFNPVGLIDARNGSVYQASTAIPYSAGVTRAIRLDVDLVSRTYSAWVDGQLLADRFSFRSQQAGALSLDGLTLKVDEGGDFSACNVRVVTRTVCDSTTPGQGFVNTSLPPTSVAFTATFVGVPRATNMDGVMGISAGAATSFPALAGAVRFGESGLIEVLDGAGYVPVSSQPYAANVGYWFTLIADAVDHTYMLMHSDGEVSTHQFRPQQATVSALGNFAKVSDSPAGALTVCSLRGGGAQGAAWIHDASRYGERHYSLAVSRDRLLLSGPRRTLVLEARGAVSRELPYGGLSITDAQGNLYLFGNFEGSYDGGTGPIYPTAGGGSVYVSKYDADLEPVYTRVNGTTPDVRLHSPSADAQGNVAFVLKSSVTSAAVKLDASGETRWSSDYPLNAIALDPSGQMAIGIEGESSITISKLNGFGRALWTREFPTEGVSLQGVAFDSAGNIVFWGNIDGEIQFGDGTFVARPEEGDLGLLGSLAPDGTPRFVRTTPINSIRRVVPDGAGNVLVAGTNNHWLDGRMWQLERYDAAGVLTVARGGDQLLPPFTGGASGDLAVDAMGQTYWQVYPTLHDSFYPTFLAKLRPF